jgi:hypothetical protein
MGWENNVLRRIFGSNQGGGSKEKLKKFEQRGVSFPIPPANNY